MKAKMNQEKMNQEMMEDNMSDVIKVLQINAGNGNYGGVSAMIFQIFKHIDKTKFSFDFVSPQKTTYELKRKEIEEMGGRIIELNTSGNVIKRKIQLFKRLKKLIKTNKYEIVHINSGVFFFNLEVAFICKILHVNKIIVHSHNGLDPKNKFKNKISKLFKFLLEIFATDFFTCSEEATKAMFSNKIIKNNKVIFIPNGIETNKFKFNEDVRKEYRKNLNLEDKFVIGHIGRFMTQKNHKFLIDIFNEFQKKNDSAILLLVGEGELQQNIKDYVKELNIENKVNFLGIRNDIPNLLMAMDCFVMPSFHEGLPVVGIEAQASGLNMVLSDSITKEVKVTDNLKFCSLDSGVDSWVNMLQEVSKEDNDRNDAYLIVKNSGFDIDNTVKKIEEIYCK